AGSPTLARAHARHAALRHLTPTDPWIPMPIHHASITRLCTAGGYDPDVPFSRPHQVILHSCDEQPFSRDALGGHGIPPPTMCLRNGAAWRENPGRTGIMAGSGKRYHQGR